jgi:hypothetical protein
MARDVMQIELVPPKAQKIELEKIGLPPESGSDIKEAWAQRLDFLPKVLITPAIPELMVGLHGFHLKQAIDEFKRDFESTAKQAGISSIQSVKLPLEVFYLAESFPSETFQSEYGESFLESFSNVVSGGLSELSFMMGARDAGEALAAIEKTLSTSGGTIGGFIGGGLGATREAATKTIDSLISQGGAAETLGRSLQLASKVVTGGRLDAPSVWKNSSYGTSYAITVRLYNPNPGSDRATEKFILAPLIALLLLVLPTAKRLGGTSGERTKGIYHFPYLCKLDSPGIFNLPSGFVSSINVIKGGDQGLYGHNQHIGMCDVRIEFGNLYTTMVHGIGNDPDIPTLVNYIKGLASKKRVHHGVGDTNLSASRKTSSTKKEQELSEITESPTDRINEQSKEKSNTITGSSTFKDIKGKLT